MFPFGEPWDAFGGLSSEERFSTYQRDDESGLDYAMARYYASRSGRFMTPDPGHVGADPKEPQSWNAYAYTANDPINRIDPSGENYIVCWDRGGCFDIEDADYESYRSDIMRLGAILPTPLLDHWPEDQFVGTITYNGAFVGNVNYYLTTAQRFAREMNRRADAAEDLLLVAAGGSVALGVTGGLAVNALGLTSGSGLTTLGPIVQKVVTPSPGQIAQMQRVLVQQGRAAVERAIRSLEKRLAEHLEKIRAAKEAGGHTSSMEREVENFRQLIEAARRVLGR